MASAAHDYQHFMRWLHHPQGQVSEDARRFGRLVLDNFEGISATSRNRSQRSINLVGLARQQFVGLDPAQPVLDALAGGPGWQWQKLSQLTLGPFRGFRNPESFDLTKRIILFYGPNGSGKTSLCEALEFALLGRWMKARKRELTRRSTCAMSMKAGLSRPSCWRWICRGSLPQ